MTGRQTALVVADPSTAWTSEGSEIPVSDQDLDEIECTPDKLAGLVVVSNELAADSDPSALDVVGDASPTGLKCSRAGMDRVDAR